MSNLAHELAASLESEGDKTIEFFKSLTPEQWDLPIYSEGPGWRVHDLLAHFTEVEGSISKLVRQVVEGGSGVPEDFDIDRWNAKHTGEISLQDRDWLLAEFERRRQATVATVRALSDADLEKRGRHPALGVTEVNVWCAQCIFIFRDTNAISSELSSSNRPRRYNHYGMPSEYAIADMYLFPLTREAGRLKLLRESDHLLRRFGQLELLDLAAGEQTEFTLRAEADRFLFPISGSFVSTLLDLRETSPSKNARAEFTLTSEDPQGLLVPFGVACSVAAKSAARLIILSTHSESHPQDRSATSDELASYTASQ